MSLEAQSPNWEWYFIALYFFVGGIAAGAYFIGSLIELFGDDRHRNISRVAYYIAFPVILLAPILLIADLGRPDRTFNLFLYAPTGLPYVNWQSALSVGSWALLFFGVMAGLSFVDNLIADKIADKFFNIPGVKLLTTLFGQTYNRIPRKLYAIAGSFFGFFVASYTGVLLNTSARPLWDATSPLIGALFIASAASSGAAAIYLVLAIRNSLAKFDLVGFEMLDRITKVFELVLAIALVVIAGQFAAPLMSGMFAVMFWGGAIVLGIIAPLALNWYTAHNGKPATQSSGLVLLMAVLVLIGGAFLRIAIVQAGQI